MKEQEKNKILIVDEDSNYISGLRKGLTQAGFEVLYFDDTRKALEIISNIKPSLIVAEVELSENSKYSFFNAVKSNSELINVPFIFLSNQKRVDDRIHAIEMGVDDFIMKPFFIEEVVARIENLLNEMAELENANSINESGFAGNLSEMNVIDLIQTLEVGKKSGIVHVKQNNFEGQIYIKDGEVFDAIFEDYPPNLALLKLLIWTSGRFFVELNKVSRPKTIEQNNAQIIAEGFNRLKKFEHVAKDLPPLNNSLALNHLTMGKSELSPEEVKILDSMNGGQMIFDIMVHGAFDDLKTLEIINSLYQKGFLKETGAEVPDEKKKSPLSIGQNIDKSISYRHQTSYVLTNLLSNSEEEQELKTERRREDRRQLINRRQISDRRRNHRIYDHKVFLDKTELLMIRGKLS